MSKARVKQALKIMQRQQDYSIEILQKAEEEEIESALTIIAKKAYRAEVAKKKKKKRYDNFNKTNPNSSI